MRREGVPGHHDDRLGGQEKQKDGAQHGRPPRIRSTGSRLRLTGTRPGLLAHMLLVEALDALRCPLGRPDAVHPDRLVQMDENLVVLRTRKGPV